VDFKRSGPQTKKSDGRETVALESQAIRGANRGEPRPPVTARNYLARTALILPHAFAASQHAGRELSLFPDMAYHRPDDAGFFAVLSATSPTRDGYEQPMLSGELGEQQIRARRELRQRSYPLDYLPTFLRTTDPTRTTYISQGEFWEPNRRTVNLARIGLSFIDLDTYRSPIAHLSEREVVEFVRTRCDEERVPDPSLMVASGRGYYAKWLFDRPIPRDALPRWNAVQQRMIGALRDLGADAGARDVSRVLRVVGTANEKTGERVKIIWSNDVAGAPVRYGFDKLVDETLELLRESHHERKDEAAGDRIVRTDKQRAALLSTAFTQTSLWWARLEDLRRLVELRGYRNGVDEGHRDLFLFVAATALGWCVNPNVVYREIAALGREFAPTLSRAEWYSYTSTTFNRAKASWDSPDHEQRYRYTTERLIQKLSIVPCEMRQLSTLIDADEKRRRDRLQAEKTRRAAGAAPRDTYIGRAAERAAAARNLAETGLSQRAIAAALGISDRQVRNYLAGGDPEKSVPLYGGHGYSVSGQSGKVRPLV